MPNTRLQQRPYQGCRFICFWLGPRPPILSLSPQCCARPPPKLATSRVPLSEYFHTNTPRKTPEPLTKSFKYVIIASDKDIFVGLTNYNREPTILHFLKLPEFRHLQESSSFDILHSWVLSNLSMGSRSLKALHASLPREDLENRDAELGKFWAAPVPAPSKMLGWVQAKGTDPSSRHHKRVSFDENQSFYSYHVYLS